MYKAAIEAGGTKCIVAVGLPGQPPLREARIPTRGAAETIADITEFFLGCRKDKLDFDALGIGSFGPVDLDPRSKTWGYVTETPKKGWANQSFAPALASALGVPVAFDTDVNTAALAESRFGAGAGSGSLVYLTIGTGIGGGAVIDGKMVHGLVHPEMGHAFLKKHPEDTFAGSCPFHGDCAEGLAAGPAVEARWKTRGENLPPDHKAWDMEAWYVAQLVVNLQMILSPECIILGGGVMDVPGIRDSVRRHAEKLGAGYLTKPRSSADWTQLIKAPALDKPGLQGAFIIAAELA